MSDSLLTQKVQSLTLPHHHLADLVENNSSRIEVRTTVHSSQPSKRDLQEESKRHQSNSHHKGKTCHLTTSADRVRLIKERRQKVSTTSIPRSPVLVFKCNTKPALKFLAWTFPYKINLIIRRTSIKWRSKNRQRKLQQKSPQIRIRWISNSCILTCNRQSDR